MSFDLNLVCLKEHDDLDMFPSIIVRKAFEPFVEKSVDDTWYLKFPDGGGGEMGSIEDDEIETNGVSIFSASGFDVYDALYEVLRQTNSVLVWSFGGCVTANPVVLTYVSEALIESVGMPIIVHSGAEIVAEVLKT